MTNTAAAYTSDNKVLEEDFEYQSNALGGVSRTFALTIPTLPNHLASVVTNAYLLCRIADTIEDDPHLTLDQKTEHLSSFLQTVKGELDTTTFTKQIVPILSNQLPADEIDLMKNMSRVINVTHSFSSEEQSAIERCVEEMCNNMPKFQDRGLSGLKDLPEMSSYCYTVAGVVGEMLLELFTLRHPELRAKHNELRYLARSFGQGLQMVNILKDIWDDRSRGICWLPREAFKSGRQVFEKLDDHHTTEAFQAGLQKLIEETNFHLQNAMGFIRAMPIHATGIRKFCSWALGFAVLTLRKIHQNPTFVKGEQVKISHLSVSLTVVLTNLVISSNRGLQRLFDWAMRGLPSRLKR